MRFPIDNSRVPHSGHLYEGFFSTYTYEIGYPLSLRRHRPPQDGRPLPREIHQSLFEVLPGVQACIRTQGNSLEALSGASGTPIMCYYYGLFHGDTRECDFPSENQESLFRVPVYSGFSYRYTY